MDKLCDGVRVNRLYDGEAGGNMTWKTDLRQVFERRIPAYDVLVLPSEAAASGQSDGDGIRYCRHKQTLQRPVSIRQSEPIPNPNLSIRGRESSVPEERWWAHEDIQRISRKSMQALRNKLQRARAKPNGPIRPRISP